MNYLKPKYDIGQKVYVALLSTTPKHITCPDCLGQRLWHLTLPNGEEFDVPCGRCSVWGEGSGEGTIQVNEASYYPTEMTVGSIRTDTNSKTRSVEYMLKETGVGCGQLWSESSLYSTKEEAQERCKVELEEYIKRTDYENKERSRKSKVRKPTPTEKKIRELEKEVKRLKKELDAHGK